MDKRGKHNYSSCLPFFINHGVYLDVILQLTVCVMTSCRLPSTKVDKIAQKIGLNAIALLTQLPPTSPLRKPLIKALGQGLTQSEIADSFHVSRKTVERSFALPIEENLLFSLVSRPRGIKVMIIYILHNDITIRRNVARKK